VNAALAALLLKASGKVTPPVRLARPYRRGL
jgi:hypothetical protein